MSEALIFASTNPQYDNRLLIELPVQYMKIPSSEHGENMRRTWGEHVVYKNCYLFLFWHSEQLMCTTCSTHVLPMFSPCSELGIFMYWTGNSMNNLLSYCGLVDAKIRASDIDLPVVVLGISVILFSPQLFHSAVQVNLC